MSAGSQRSQSHNPRMCRVCGSPTARASVFCFTHEAYEGASEQEARKAVTRWRLDVERDEADRRRESDRVFAASAASRPAVSLSRRAPSKPRDAQHRDELDRLFEAELRARAGEDAGAAHTAQRKLLDGIADFFGVSPKLAGTEKARADLGEAVARSGVTPGAAPRPDLARRLELERRNSERRRAQSEQVANQ